MTNMGFTFGGFAAPHMPMPAPAAFHHGASSQLHTLFSPGDFDLDEQPTRFSRISASDDAILCAVSARTNLCYRMDANDPTRQFHPLPVTPALGRGSCIGNVTAVPNPDSTKIVCSHSYPADVSRGTSSIADLHSRANFRVGLSHGCRYLADPPFHEEHNLASVIDVFDSEEDPVRLKVHYPPERWPLPNGDGGRFVRPSAVSFGAAVIPRIGVVQDELIVTSKSCCRGFKSSLIPKKVYLHIWSSKGTLVGRFFRLRELSGYVKHFGQFRPHSIFVEKGVSSKPGQWIAEYDLFARRQGSCFDCGGSLVDFGFCEEKSTLAMITRSSPRKRFSCVHGIDVRAKKKTLFRSRLNGVPSKLLCRPNSLVVGGLNGPTAWFDLRNPKNPLWEVTLGGVVSICQLRSDSLAALVYLRGAAAVATWKFGPPPVRSTFVRLGQLNSTPSRAIPCGDICFIVRNSKNSRGLELDDEKERGFQLLLELGETLFDFTLKFPQHSVRVPKWILSGTTIPDFDERSEWNVESEIDLSQEEIVRVLCYRPRHPPAQEKLFQWYLFSCHVGPESVKTWICYLVQQLTDLRLVLDILIAALRHKGDDSAMSLLQVACLNVLKAKEEIFRESPELMNQAEDDLRVFRLLYTHKTEPISMPSGTTDVPMAQHSNLTLVSHDGTEVRCHLGILLSRSGFFRRVLGFGGRERETLLTQRAIHIEEETISTGTDLIELTNLLYKRSVSPEAAKSLICLFRLHHFAAMYGDIPILRQIQTLFRSCIRSYPIHRTIIFLLETAHFWDELSDEETKWMESQFMFKFSRVSTVGWAGVMRALRSSLKCVDDDDDDDKKGDLAEADHEEDESHCSGEEG